MTSRKHIALVTTWFPPQQSVATNRMLAFAEYLSEDFKVSVFAFDQTAHQMHWNENITIHFLASKSIIDKLKSNQKDNKFKHNVKTAIRILLKKVVKDPLKKWQESVTNSLIREHKLIPFECIISSYAPQEAHLAALNFCSENPDVKWIADMRDEMSKNPGVSKQQKGYFERIEAEINRHATAITTVSQPILDDFKALCPDIQFFEEIRNGFNHNLKNDFMHQNDVFSIGYFGSFYGGRKPVTFFKALEELVVEKPDFTFEFHVVGAHRNFHIPSQFDSMVHFKPALNYLDAIQLMMKMDANVVLHPRSNQKGVFTGKLFDYISVQVPVIACVDAEDVAAKLVLEMNAGYVAECDDLEANKKAIYQAFTDWSNQHVKRVSEVDRLSLHRKSQIEKLKLLINTICS